MYNLFIGICHVSFYLRYSRSLKDKRHVINSLKQKLKNLGCSVTECGYQDDQKRVSLGFSYVDGSEQEVVHSLDCAMKFFVGDFEVLEVKKQVLDFSYLSNPEIPYNERFGSDDVEGG